MGKKAKIGAGVAIDGEREFKQALTNINNSLKVTASELSLVSAKFADNSKSIEATTAKSKLFQNQIELQKKKIDKITEALESNKAKYGETDVKTQRWQVSLNKANAELINMENNLKNNSKSVDKFGDKAKAVFTEMQSKLESLGNKMTMVGAAFTALGGAGIKTYIDFEEQFKKVTTLLDESVISQNKAREGIMAISNSTGQAASDLADAMYDALSSNVKTADSLQFLYNASRLAKTGFTDTKTSVDILTTIMNSYGLSVQQLTKISDQLIVTQNLGKVTVGELGSSFGDVSGLAAQAKVPLEDLFAAIATLTSNGVKGAESITELRSIISSVLKPTAEASELAKKLHIQFNLTALQSKGLAGFLADVQSKTNGNAESFATLFGRVEALNASLILTGKGADMYSDALTQMGTASGEVEKAMQKLSESNAEKFNESINEMKNTLIQLGGALSPVIGFISKLAAALSLLPTPILVIIPILGVVLMVGGQILSIMSQFKAVFGVAGAAVETASFGISAFGKKVLIVVGIVAGLVAIITLAVIAINALTGKSDAFINQIRAQADGYKSMSSSFSSIGHNAKGTSFWQGGLTWVGEEGPELIDVPRGSSIYNNRKSMSMLNDGSLSGGGDTYIFQPGSVVIDSKNIQEFNDIVRIAKERKQTIRAGYTGG
jgi:TP901 family phage tail tape measure protein